MQCSHFISAQQHVNLDKIGLEQAVPVVVSEGTERLLLSFLLTVPFSGSAIQRPL